MFEPFEILTAGGNRFRFETSGYRWCYGLVSGSMDIDDKTVVEVLKINEDEDYEDTLVKTFSSVVAVGYVTDQDCLVMPRERLKTQCPNCGYGQRQE